MQANKNGFFYVLDRGTGELLSAKNFTYVNWASGVDMKTGRPIPTRQSDWLSSPKNVYPSWSGAHTWNPMSYDAATHLVYIPVIDTPSVWVDLAHNGGAVGFLDGFFTTNGIFPDASYDAADLKRLFGPLPARQQLETERKVKLVRTSSSGRGIRWPARSSGSTRHRAACAATTAASARPREIWCSSGRGSGGLWIYAADTGKVLRIIDTGSHIMAAPTTYAVNGEQFVAVQAGYGGTGIAEGPVPPQSATNKYENVSRLIALKLGGGRVPMPPARVVPPFDKPPEQTASKAEIEAGEVEFVSGCSRCHALGINVTPRSAPLECRAARAVQGDRAARTARTRRHGALRRHPEREGCR